MKWSVLRCLIYIDLQSEWLGLNDQSCAVFQAVSVSQSPSWQHFRCICMWRHNARVSPVSSRVTNTLCGPDKISDGEPFVKRKMLCSDGGNLGTVSVFVFASIMPPAVLARQPYCSASHSYNHPSCSVTLSLSALPEEELLDFIHNNSHKNFHIECCLILYIFKCDP